MADDDFQYSNFGGIIRVRQEDGSWQVPEGAPQPSREEEQAFLEHQRQVDHPTEREIELVEELPWTDENYEPVIQRMRELDEIRVANGGEPLPWTNHRQFLQEFQEVKNMMVRESLDAQRNSLLADLRRQLAEEDAESGGRSTPRRTAIELKIASLMGRG